MPPRPAPRSPPPSQQRDSASKQERRRAKARAIGRRRAAAAAAEGAAEPAPAPVTAVAANNAANATTADRCCPQNDPRFVEAAETLRYYMTKTFEARDYILELQQRLWAAGIQPPPLPACLASVDGWHDPQFHPWPTG